MATAPIHERRPRAFHDLREYLSVVKEMDHLRLIEHADAELERRTGRTIPEIFAEAGEPGFRKLELELERDLLGRSGVVLATGGGVVLHEELRQRLSERMTVWLPAPVVGAHDLRLAASRRRGRGADARRGS